MLTPVAAKINGNSQDSASKADNAISIGALLQRLGKQFSI